MTSNQQSRRKFLQTTAGAASAAAVIPYFLTGQNVRADEQTATSPNDRLVLGCIGTGSRWNGVGPNAMEFADCVAICDVDRQHAERALAKTREIQSTKGRSRDVEVVEDYRRVLDNKEIDVVTIVTPDHWHTKIAIEAMQAGKDVYCEKPLTLTIEEGKQIIKALEQTNRVFQVGTQQRSEMGQRFLLAVGLVKNGRIGEVQKVRCAIGGAPDSGPLEKTTPPSHLNWDLWLGQAPLVDFIERRCHYEFRWWYEYSGGKMTDWGAHHVDIAQWAIGMDESGPIRVSGDAEHPVPFENGHPTVDNQYNTATKFAINCQFPNGVELEIVDADPEFDNGIMFEGTEGRFLVNRGKIVGAPVEALESNPLPEGWLQEIYGGKTPADRNAHMANFFECLKQRQQPISDVYTHHRAMTTCHLANIAIRLGRPLQWDPDTQQVVGDEQANAWQSREQREGYETKV